MLKNSFGKVDVFFFQILVTWLFSQNENSFLAAILKQNIFWMGFSGVYRYGASFVSKLVLKVDQPCAQTGVKWSLGT